MDQYNLLFSVRSAPCSSSNQHHEYGAIGREGGGLLDKEYEGCEKGLFLGTGMMEEKGAGVHLSRFLTTTIYVSNYRRVT